MRRGLIQDNRHANNDHRNSSKEPYIVPETKPITIGGTFTLESIEDHHSTIASANARRLRLPLTPDTKGFGTELALGQLLVSWSRRFPNGMLELNLSNARETLETQLRRFSKRTCGIIAASMAASIGDLNRAPYTSLARQTVGRVLQTYWSHKASDQKTFWEDDSMDSESIPRMGHRAILPCVDHTQYWNLPQLYHAKANLRDYTRDRTEFVTLTERVLRQVAGSASHSNMRVLPVSPDLIRGIGSILFELFDNTHRWARTTAEGAVLDRSIRLIEFRRWDTETTRDGTATSVGPLANYLSRIEREFGKRPIIEISVLDSGPGLAARSLGQEIEPGLHSVEKELGEVYKCLQKGTSSSRESSRGFGLYHVMRSLSELRGFLRLRTGRLCLFRDLIERPIQFREGAFENSLVDWVANEDSITKHNAVVGAAFTLLFPIL